MLKNEKAFEVRKADEGEKKIQSYESISVND